jgi:NodT family efflux transporter outer membrane factor (OMF) lipoprotein
LQEANLATLAATLPPLRKALAIQRDLLAALTGRPPSEPPPEIFQLADLHLPVDLPLSLSSQLIEQRPDVRSAEEQLHSASAQVGVAIANMLPNITLSGSRGYTATDLAALTTYFQHFSLFWTVAGSATQTVFDGFTLLHTKRAAEAAYDQAAWNYRTTVITALQNVADALHAIQNDADALQAARANERAWKLSFDLTLQQYRAGAVNIVALLQVQQVYQTAVIALVQAQTQRLTDTAGLYQALGGGWWNRPQPLQEKKFDVAKDAAVPMDWTLPCGPAVLPCIR